MLLKQALYLFILSCTVPLLRHILTYGFGLEHWESNRILKTLYLGNLGQIVYFLSVISM